MKGLFPNLDLGCLDSKGGELSKEEGTEMAQGEEIAKVEAMEVIEA